VQAGDRAPDARLVAAGGTPCRLFDVLRGPRFTLLVYSVEPGQSAELLAAVPPGLASRLAAAAVGPAQERLPGPWRTFVDADGTFRTAYGPEGPTVLLVRPDKYVGFVGRPDAALLGQHFRSLLAE
jgi:hypothetical protein